MCYRKRSIAQGKPNRTEMDTSSARTLIASQQSKLSLLTSDSWYVHPRLPRSSLTARLRAPLPPPAHRRVASATIPSLRVLDDLLILIVNWPVGFRESIAFLPDPQMLGCHDMPGLELSAGPGVAAFAVRGVWALDSGCWRYRLK